MNERFWIDVIGWVASVLIVAAYALNVSGRIRADAPFYLWGNILGSFGLVLNTVYLGAYPSAAVNIIWVAIGLWGVAKSRKKVILK